MMKETFLQFVWMHNLYEKRNWFFGDDVSIEIINGGTLNHDSGPDFTNACIKIGGVKWVGNVEIHINSSDWEKHQHHKDKAYNNVILHVVLNNDGAVTRENGELLPTIEIAIEKTVLQLNERLVEEFDWPACKLFMSDVPDIYWSVWLNRLMIERLQSKTEQVEQLLKELKTDWEQCFFIYFLKYFGLNVNQLPFELLGRKTPVNAIYRQKGNLFQIEAILFGQSGLLNDALLGDDYFLQLRDEYHHLRKKFGMNGIEPHLWKFLRMRPSNFPTIRIAQLAQVLNQTDDLLNFVLNAEHVSDLRRMLNVQTSDYWESHYVFNKDAKKTSKKIGKSSVDTIIINAIIPFLYVYAELNAKPYLQDRVMKFLEELPPENNKVVNRWKDLGCKAKNALDSQGLLQLKNVYCNHKKCISCQIGAKLYLRRMS